MQITRLNLPDPRLKADVTYESWDPWTEGASALHPGWYADDPMGALTSLMLGPEAAMRVSVVNRCVSIIANTLAPLPCILYRQTGDRKERAREHRAYKVVRRSPNPWQSQFHLFRDMQANVSLRGAAYARFRDDGFQQQLLPLRSQHMSVEQMDSGRLRFKYRDPKTGMTETLLQDEVLYVRDIAPDYVTGIERAVLAKEAIAISNAAEHFVGRFFVNDASGRLVAEGPGFQSKDKRDEFMNYLRMNAMGSHNAKRPLFAWGGTTFKELGKTREEEFLVDPRKYQAADIARVWGVPGFLIGLEEKSTSWGTGIAEQKQGFVDFTIKPEAISWQESLRMLLLNEEEQEDHYFEFQFGALLQGNPVQQAEAFGKYKEMGVYSPNEIRSKLNENPREGGDEYQDSVPGAAPNQATESAPAAGRVPVSLLVDASARIAKAMGRGGAQQRAGQVATVLLPLADAYRFPSTYIDRVTAAVEAEAHGAEADRRSAIVLRILDETFTAETAEAAA